MLAKNLEVKEWGYVNRELRQRFHKADLFEFLYGKTHLPEEIEREVLRRRKYERDKV